MISSSRNQTQRRLILPTLELRITREPSFTILETISECKLQSSSTGNRLIFLPPFLLFSSFAVVAVFPGFHNAVTPSKVSKNPTPNRSARFFLFFYPLYPESRSVKGDEKCKRVESTRRACYRANTRNNEPFRREEIPWESKIRDRLQFFLFLLPLLWSARFTKVSFDLPSRDKSSSDDRWTRLKRSILPHPWNRRGFGIIGHLVTPPPFLPREEEGRGEVCRGDVKRYWATPSSLPSTRDFHSIYIYFSSFFSSFPSLSTVRLPLTAFLMKNSFLSSCPPPRTSLLHASFHTGEVTSNLSSPEENENSWNHE